MAGFNGSPAGLVIGHCILASASVRQSDAPPRRHMCTLSRSFTLLHQHANLGLPRPEDSSPQKIKVGAAEHLPLDRLQTVDLPFGLSVAPGKAQRCFDCRKVLL